MSKFEGPKDDATEEEKTQFWKDQFSKMEERFVQQIDDLKREYEAKLEEARSKMKLLVIILPPQVLLLINLLKM